MVFLRTSDAELLLFIKVLHSGASDTCRQQRTFVSMLLCDAPQAAAPSGSQHEGYCLQPTDGLVLLENGCRSNRIETRYCSWTSRDTEESCGGRTALSVSQIQWCMGSFMGISTWSLRVKQKRWFVVALLVSLVQTRTFATGMLQAPPVERTMWCCCGKKGLGHFCFIVLYLPLKPSGRGDATPWRKTLDALYKWTDGLLMSLPTRCMPVLMLDLMTDRVGHAPKNHMTSLEQWERESRETVPHVSEPSHVDTQLLCHKRFIWLQSHFMVRVDDHESILLPPLPSVQVSRIFVNFTAGRRLQLIPAAGPRNHMPLTLDLVTNGMRHCPDPTRGRWNHEKIKEMLSDPVARFTFFKKLETKIRNSSIVGLATTEATPDDAWENLVQRIFRKQLVPTSTRVRHDPLGRLLWNEDVYYWNLVQHDV